MSHGVGSSNIIQSLIDLKGFCEFPACALQEALGHIPVERHSDGEYSDGMRLKRHVRLFPLLGLAWAVALPASASTLFSSGPSRVALIELYTSEGCSSCPPADAWLGRLREKKGLWKDFVPVQFHVDYWDDLGWKDRLSSKSYTARQYAYASSWGSQNVYTPCFVRNGSEWKTSWGSVGGRAAPVGLLTVDYGDDGVSRVEFRPGPAARLSPDGLYEVHLAILGGGLSSQVTAGENRGSTLLHEFVVLGLADQVLAPAAPGAPLGATVPLPHLIMVPPARRALAAWITPHREMEPVQAVGGWIP